MLYLEYPDGSGEQMSIAAHAEKLRVDTRFMNQPGAGWQGWQWPAEQLCTIAILDCILARVAVPQFGRDVADWWKIHDFLPGVLQPFMHSKMMLPYSHQVRNQLRFAYEAAYKRVRNWFPWLEQNSTQVT